MHPIASPQPRRTVLWDEATASYIWLDPRERDVARSIRANRIAFQTERQEGLYSSGLADLWNPSEYDADTRHVARSRERARRPEVKAQRIAARKAARDTNKAPAPFYSTFDPINFDDVLPFMADVLAALVVPPTLADVLAGLGRIPTAEELLE